MVAAAYIEKRLVYADRFDLRRKIIQDVVYLAGDLAVLCHIDRQEYRVGTSPIRLGYGHRRTDAEGPRLVGAGRDDAAAPAIFRVGAHHHGPAAVRGVIPL